MKCDEQKPVCQNCINSRRKCYRGIRLNFTQYTLYDPKDSLNNSQNPSSRNESQKFRILDQSIAVSTLYEEGPERYKAFRKLHRPEDLKEAESKFMAELLPQPASLSAGNSSISPGRLVASEGVFNAASSSKTGSSQNFFEYPFNPTNQACFTLKESMFIENYDIKNYLLHQQQQQLLNTAEPIRDYVKTIPSILVFHSQTNFDPTLEPDLALNPSNMRVFISVIQSQNYAWLLDLFNEITVWKSVVPNYCIKLLQAAEAPTVTKRGRLKLKFLFGCILCCADLTPLEKLTNLAKVQLDLWREFRTKEISVASFPSFERLLLSVVLILCSVMQHTSKPSFHYTQELAAILANQGRILNKLIGRYQGISSSKIRRLSSASLVITSFQAITILRFFIKKQLLQKAPVSFMSAFNPLHKIDSPLEQVIDYDTSGHNISDFFAITPFELDHIVLPSQDKDLNPNGSSSDSKKLRLCLLRLVRQEYLSENIAMDDLSETTNYGQSSILIPNDKCVALNILNSYFMSKFHHKDEGKHTAKARLRHIFDMISKSMMSEDVKQKWITCFGWTLL